MNIQTNQVEVVILIWHQILVTNLQGDVLQLEGRINYQILGLKGSEGPKKVDKVNGIFWLCMLLTLIMSSVVLGRVSLTIYGPLVLKIFKPIMSMGVNIEATEFSKYIIL